MLPLPCGPVRIVITAINAAMLERVSALAFRNGNIVSGHCAKVRFRRAEVKEVFGALHGHLLLWGETPCPQAAGYDAGLLAEIPGCNATPVLAAE